MGDKNLWIFRMYGEQVMRDALFNTYEDARKVYDAFVKMLNVHDKVLTFIDGSGAEHAYNIERIDGVTLIDVARSTFFNKDCSEIIQDYQKKAGTAQSRAGFQPTNKFEFVKGNK